MDLVWECQIELRLNSFVPLLLSVGVCHWDRSLRQNLRNTGLWETPNLHLASLNPPGPDNFSVIWGHLLSSFPSVILLSDFQIAHFSPLNLSSLMRTSLCWTIWPLYLDHVFINSHHSLLTSPHGLFVLILSWSCLPPVSCLRVVKYAS